MKSRLKRIVLAGKDLAADAAIQKAKEATTSAISKLIWKYVVVSNVITGSVCFIAGGFLVYAIK